IRLSKFISRKLIDGIDRVLYPLRVLYKIHHFVGEHSADTQKGEHDDDKGRNDDGNGGQGAVPTKPLYQPDVDWSENGVHHNRAQQSTDDSANGVSDDQAQQDEQNECDDVSLSLGKYGIRHSKRRMLIYP